MARFCFRTSRPREGEAPAEPDRAVTGLEVRLPGSAGGSPSHSRLRSGRYSSTIPIGLGRSLALPIMLCAIKPVAFRFDPVFGGEYYRGYRSRELFFLGVRPFRCSREDCVCGRLRGGTWPPPSQDAWPIATRSHPTVKAVPRSSSCQRRSLGAALP